MATTTYCDADDVAFVLSDAGVTARVDDFETGTRSTAGDAFVTSAIEIAAGKINMLVKVQYPSLAALTTNDWLKWTNAYLAAEILERRRGNPVAESIAAECQERRDLLVEISWGRRQLPEQTPQLNPLPTMSNLTPELHKINNPVRTIVEESTGGNPVDGVMRNTARDGTRL